MKRFLAILIALTLLTSACALAEGGRPGDPPSGGKGGFGGGTPSGGKTASFEYAAAEEITQGTDVSGAAYASDDVDVSALIVHTDEAVTLEGITVSKTGDSDGGDNCNFYGLNAAPLVMGGSATTITNATITSDASGANGGS